MEILTWNVNGLRAIVRKDKWQQILDMSPDIICLQETKAHPDQLDENIRSPEGYHSYFASSTVRKGYSGVATFTKKEPRETLVGLGVEKFDEQGRVLTHIYDDVALINAYFPNGASKTASLDYEHAFFEEFLMYVEALEKKGHAMIICGDINVAHEAIDLARPDENKKSIGFLPEERAWLDEFERRGLVDVFRRLHPNTEAYTYWDMRTRARERNVGWRLDYFYVTEALMKRVESIEIMSDIYGSDHCPVLLTIS